jgi:hypothetical protein
MRVSYVAVFVLAWIGGWSGTEPLQLTIGISAQADPVYYTRKRVNGVWITGKFPRKRPTEKIGQVASAVPTDVGVTSSIPVTAQTVPSMIGLALPYSAASPSQSAEYPHYSDDPRREGLRLGLEQLARRIADAN